MASCCEVLSCSMLTKQYKAVVVSVRNVYSAGLMNSVTVTRWNRNGRVAVLLCGFLWTDDPVQADKLRR